jgi:pimeloyl-ACP methyl ester carboxylesterase
VSTLSKVVGSATLVGGLVGAAALGGATAQRLALLRYREMGYPDTDLASLADSAGGLGLGALPSDRSYSVAASDGVVLHVEEVGPPDAPLTVVFSHGWTLQSGAWHFQRLALSGRAGSPTSEGGDTSPDGGGPGGPSPATEPLPQLRLVFYDQRSHGRSSRAAPGRIGIDDLAGDLAAVIGTAAPAGPLVLVGHSMGGMAVMALARREPELFADRVCGVALLSTSASESGPRRGRWLQVNGANPVLPLLVGMAGRYPRLVERGRSMGRDAVWLMTRSLGFADPKVPAPLVDYLDRMISATPMDVIADFAPALFSHDERDALATLAGIPTLIAVGDADRMTPPDRSHALAEALPDATLLVIPGAGHMAIMEAPEPIDTALRELVLAAWTRVRHSGRHSARERA